MVKQRRDYLTHDEIETLTTAASTQRKRREVAIALVTLSYHHGLRVSEAAMLQWSDIYWDSDELYIRRVKGSTSGIHEMIDTDRQVLSELLDYQKASRFPASPHVFTTERGESYLKRKRTSTSTGQAYTAPGLSAIIKRLGDQCSDEIAIAVHAHCLRHSCGTHLARKNVNAFQIKQWLGHRSIASTQQYVDLAGQRLPTNAFAV